MRVPARRPHECGLYSTQVVCSGMNKLSIMCLKACQDSLVAMDADSERPIENLTSSTLDSTRDVFCATRKFGLFSSFEACFQHFKCI